MCETETPPPIPKLLPAIFTVLGIAAIAGLIALPWLTGDPTTGLSSQWARFLGHFHPVVLHLPIGMLTLVILIEFGNLFRKETAHSTAIPIFFTALSAAVAVIFGVLLFRSKPGEYNEILIQSHLWWGTAFACLMVFCFVMKLWVNATLGNGRGVYFMILLGSGGVMAIASHDGGSLTHGKSFLMEEAPNEVRKVYNMLPISEKLPLQKPGGSKNNDSQKSSAPTVPAADQVIYTHLIHPILEAKCVACHGEEKQKGKFRMDTYEALLAGGKEGDGIEPGNAKDSNILYRIHLPEDDDEHMPPEGKKQIEAHELALLEWWINNGASPDLKLADADIPDDIKAAISSIVPAEDLAAAKEQSTQTAAKDADARKAIAAKLEVVRKEFPSAINFESQDSSGLTFNAVSMRKTFDDEQLKKLTPVIPSLVSLNLSATPITDQGIALLTDAGQLKMLRLSETGITDKALETIATLPELESLNLYGTKITTAGALKLAALPKLKRLYLWQTQVDEAAAADLRKKMPDCEIVLGF